LRGAQARQKAIDWLNRVGIPEAKVRIDDFPFQFSGGQKQRLGIARAIITDAPVMIFDDALSNIDAHTANDIVHNVSAARRGKTTIMVSQKISAVRHLDAIIVLDKGKLVEYGTHEQLIALNGIYTQLYQRELSAH
jgi:ATP-binding cassette subfamily B protein